MSRVLIYIILTILVGGWLGNLIVKDPGYVLLSYDGATLQTSLWIFLAAWVVLLAIVVVMLRFIGSLLTTGGVFHNWRTRRRLSRANDLTSRGISSLIEGHWMRAQNYLIRGAEDSSQPLINYLGAASAAQQQGDHDKRDEFIQLARDRVTGSELTIAISEARNQIAARQWDQALITLHKLPRSTCVLELLFQVYGELNDWKSSKDLLPEAKKYVTGDRYTELGKLIWQSLFNQLAAKKGIPVSDKSLEHLRKCWKEVSAELRNDEAILIPYVKCLVQSGAGSESVQLISKALQHRWSDKLVDYFGLIEIPNHEDQIRSAEAWLQLYPDNPQVLLCVGRLQVQNGNYESARHYLEKSLAILRCRETCIALGGVMAKLGDHVRSNQLYLMAMVEESRAVNGPG